MREKYATQVLYSCRYPSLVRSPVQMTASGSISFSSTMTRFIRFGTKKGEPTCGSEMWAMVTTFGSSLPPVTSAQTRDRRLASRSRGAGGGFATVAWDHTNQREPARPGPPGADPPRRVQWVPAWRRAPGPDVRRDAGRPLRRRDRRPAAREAVHGHDDPGGGRP